MFFYIIVTFNNKHLIFYLLCNQTVDGRESGKGSLTAFIKPIINKKSDALIIDTLMQ